MATKFFFKTALCAVFALVCTAASAQKVVKNIDVRDTTACVNYLMKSLGDTIKAVSRFEKNDTVFVKTTRVFVKNNAVVFRTDSDVYVVDPEYLAKKAENAALLDTLYKKSVDALFVEKVKSAGERNKRDTYFTEVGDSLRIPHASADKYGASIEISAGCLFSETVTSPLLSIGFEYSGSWWAGILNAEIGWNKYNKNAVNAGSSYLTYSTELLGAVQPFKLNKSNTARLFLVGGAGFQWYSTDSKPWMGEDGQWEVGCNVESASYGRGLCADRTALFLAVGDGEDRILVRALPEQGRLR